MFLTRFITAAVALVIFIPTLFFSNTFAFDAVMTFGSVVGTIELLRCVKVADKYIISVPSVIVSGLVPMLIRYCIDKKIIGAVALIVVAYLFYLLYAAMFTRKQTSTNDIALCFFATIYVTISFASILAARTLEYGEILYLMIFIGAWSTDTFAYLTGRLIGRHKLPLKIRDVSPNKTIEGAIGGIVFCSASFIVYGFIISALNRFNAVPNYVLLALTGIVTSVIAQLGDLSASAIKRNYDVKDFGSIFPGHGGILDRVDSVLAVAPVILIIGAAFIKVNAYGLFT